MLDIKKMKAAINLISAEKKISKEKLIEIIESAIKTAYKKDYGTKDEVVNVKLDIEANSIEIVLEKTLVREVTNSSIEISFEELWDDAEWFVEGDTIEIDVTDEVMDSEFGESFWRIASQAARQVIIQKIGENEKEQTYELFKDKQWEIVSMKLEMVEWTKVVFDYNGNNIPLFKGEQVMTDNYIPGERMYIYIAEVSNEEWVGPKVVLSRKRAELVELLFWLYVPELNDGTITIDKVVRKAWFKTKLLVSSCFDQIDPIGTLVWPKWIRVKSVMDELFGEKIDIIKNSDDITEILAKAFTPATVEKVQLDEENQSAIVTVSAWHRSKAVWKGWLNIRMVSELTWYMISLKEQGE